MANNAEPYIAAVADACQAVGLHVVDFWTDDIDPRDGGINLTLDPDADLDGEDWWQGRTLGWDEEKGWLIGQPKDPHGELTRILYLGATALPDPADVAEQARKVIAGEFSPPELVRLMQHVHWRDQDDDDDFDSQLAGYAPAAAEDQDRKDQTHGK